VLALNVRQHRGFRYWRSGRDATGKSLIWVGRADIEERVTLIGSEHFGEYATVEGVVAKVFTSKSGNTFLNIGATYPNQTFTGWIAPASPVSKSELLSDIEGKHVKISGRIAMYKGKPAIRINAASQLEVE
jgi:DNA/RNA endonuclease YhcR with UshA esterase domain